GGGNGGVLGFGPVASAAAPSCTISLLSRTIAVHGRGLAGLKLAWAGTGICTGTLTLKLKLKLKQRPTSKRSRSRGPARVKTIGTASFSVAAGAVGVVNVKLNGTGRVLLRAARAGLNASLLIVKQSPGPARAQTASVRLMQAKSRSNKAPKR
ncbi:MAG: hypothetical protein M3Z95_05905, partial [Actinomycetota bacterium]|nr:hypothetical protein [Actinomycetota bacterium]